MNSIFVLIVAFILAPTGTPVQYSKMYQFSTLKECQDAAKGWMLNAQTPEMHAMAKEGKVDESTVTLECHEVKFGQNPIPQPQTQKKNAL